MARIVAGRRLSLEEAALWAQVARTVRPLGPTAAPPLELGEQRTPIPANAPRSPVLAKAPAPATSVRSAGPGETLDGGWDRRLRGGTVAPERTIDLHGHTLASAHAALDRALERALADEVRLLLLVTGRPPRSGDTVPRRGLIRAAIGDWLGSSRHAGRIAAVRNAHPRHGGAGALYVVLRRRRS